MDSRAARLITKILYNNTVNLVISFSNSSLFSCMIQIVTALDLSKNVIRNKGGRMIAYLISHNNV